MAVVTLAPLSVWIRHRSSVLKRDTLAVRDAMSLRAFALHDTRVRDRQKSEQMHESMNVVAAMPRTFRYGLRPHEGREVDGATLPFACVHGVHDERIHRCKRFGYTDARCAGLS